MDYVIEFFRDILSGPLYVIVVIIAVILFFACIGYLAEKSINKKKESMKYANVNDTVEQDSTVVNEIVSNVGSDFQDEITVTNNVNDMEGAINTTSSNGVSEEVVPSVEHVTANDNNPVLPVQEVVPVTDKVIPTINQDNKV